MALSRPSSLNPNADPFLYTTPFLLPPPPTATKLEIFPIPIFKTTPFFAPPLHGYYQFHHPPMFISPQLPYSWPPCSDAFTFAAGVDNSVATTGDQQNMKRDQRKLKIKKWGSPQVRWKLATDPQFPSHTELTPLETQTTTLMIKNIPNQFRRHHLLKILDDHCKWKNQSSNHNNINSFDFVYLPMDFRKYWYDGKISNLGYAFVNFTSPTAATEFCEAFHRRQWDVLVNRKVCEIKRAKLQGLKALMEAFRNKIFWCHSNNYLPVVLEPPSDGCCPGYRVTPVGKRIPRPPPSPIKKCG